MKRYYKLIALTSELKELQRQADEEGAIAIGVSRSGALYEWDGANHKAASVSVPAVAEALNLSAEQVQQIIDSKGTVVFDESEPESEPVADEPEQVEDPAEATQETEGNLEETCEEPEQEEENDDEKTIVTVLSKADLLEIADIIGERIETVCVQNNDKILEKLDIIQSKIDEAILK